MKKVLFTIAILGITTLSFAQNQEDNQAIEQAIENLAIGWKNGDGNTFASSFASVHDFIVWNGFYFKDMKQEANAEAHTNLFKRVYPNTKLYHVIDKIKYIRQDIALVHVLGAVAEKSKPRPTNPQVLYSVILDKSSGEWKIISFHNLDLEVFQDEEIRKNSPMPPQVMYANWYTTK